MENGIGTPRLAGYTKQNLSLINDTVSLVPRHIKSAPGIHCSRMCVISALSPLFPFNVPGYKATTR